MVEARSDNRETDRRRVLLIGAGHAHLHVAARAGDFAARGIDLVLVDPGRFWYSSMATGLLGGEYEAADDSLDPHALIAARGGQSLRARAVAVDREERSVVLEDGRRERYDLVSLNVGSGVPHDLVEPGVARVWSAKPISELLAFREALERGWRNAPDARPDVLVVGLGLAGTELALNLDALARRRGGRIALRVLGGDPPETRTSGRLEALLSARGIAIERMARVERIREGRAVLEDGTDRRFDHAVLATGLRAHPLTHRLGLAHGETEGLHVTPMLHAFDDPCVFAAGDCAHMPDHPRPKVGVFGVRAAPILAHNLLASLVGEPLRSYRPQKRWLWVANCGDGTGLAAWGGDTGTAPNVWEHSWLRPGLLWRGRSALWIKRTIDRRFMRRYRAP